MRATIDDEEHAADGFDIWSRLGAEVFGEQFCHARRAVPCEAVEIITHRVEAALAGADVDGLVNSILADALEPEVLQPVCMMPTSMSVSGRGVKSFSPWSGCISIGAHSISS